MVDLDMPMKYDIILYVGDYGVKMGVLMNYKNTSILYIQDYDRLLSKYLVKL